MTSSTDNNTKQELKGVKAEKFIELMLAWLDKPLPVRNEREPWREGSRNQQREPKWLVRGPSEGVSTSKTLVRGQRKAEKYAKGLGKEVQQNDNDPNPKQEGEFLSYLTDHKYEGSRRQRKAAGLL